MVNGEIIEMVGEVIHDEKTLAPHKIKFLKVDDTFEDSLEFTFIALDFDGNELPKRDFKIRKYKGLEISHGIYSSNETAREVMVMADLIQDIIVGAIAKRLLNKIL
jgi:hypothetical protein